MTLKRVDLPQPDGPMTARNSPGATLNDMWSTATIGPSAVSKRFDTSSTTKMASAGRGALASEAGDTAAGTMRYLATNTASSPAQAGGPGPHDGAAAAQWRPQATVVTGLPAFAGNDGVSCGSLGAYPRILVPSRPLYACLVIALATLGP